MQIAVAGTRAGMIAVSTADTASSSVVVRDVAASLGVTDAFLVASFDAWQGVALLWAIVVPCVAAGSHAVVFDAASYDRRALAAGRNGGSNFHWVIISLDTFAASVVSVVPVVPSSSSALPFVAGT